VYQIYTLFVFSIGAFEIRYLTQRLPAPRLTWYYQAFYEHELKQMYLGWQDTLEERSRQFLTETKEQIDYYLIHKEFVYIKKRLLSNYLQNERATLCKHFYDRTINMLSTIENLENSNIKNQIKEITDESLAVVLNLVNDPLRNEEILESSFTSALDGLSTGKMEYRNDKILPMFLDELKMRTTRFHDLTADEENKMFAVSADQRKYLMDSDTRLKNEYLSQAPNVASGVKNTEVYKNIVARMKSRVDVKA
jgi:hypothetical protein